MKRLFAQIVESVQQPTQLDLSFITWKRVVIAGLVMFLLLQVCIGNSAVALVLLIIAAGATVCAYTLAPRWPQIRKLLGWTDLK